MKCPICGKPVNAPSRRIVDGRIVEGCIDDSHTGHLTPGTNSHAWHHRKSAKAHRAECKRYYRSIGIRPKRPGVGIPDHA